MTKENGLVFISGASAGIGKALAFEFAKHRHPLILNARNAEALGKLASEISTRYQVTVEVLAADLSTLAGIQQVSTAIAQHSQPVEILVNNAGFSVHGDFFQTSAEAERSLITLQLIAMNELCKAALPAMRERGCGRIVNVASVYSFFPVPLQAVYGAVKAYMLSFSRALAEELSTSNISVSAICPGLTYTEFRQRAGLPEKRHWIGLSAEEVAKRSYRGILAGKFFIIPGLGNKLLFILSKILPARMLMNSIAGINRQRFSAQPETHENS